MKKRKKAIAVILIMTIVLSCVPMPTFASDESINLADNATLIQPAYRTLVIRGQSIVFEVKEVVSAGWFFYPEPAQSLIPDGAIIHEVSQSKAVDTIYLSYTLNGVSVSESHLPDGRIATSKRIGDTVYYTGPDGTEDVIQRTEIMVSMNEDKVNEIKAAVEASRDISQIEGIDVIEINGGSIVRMASNDAQAQTSSINTVNNSNSAIRVNALEDSFPPYNAVIMRQEYLPYSSLNASRWTFVYESQGNYIERTCQFTFLEAWSTLSTISEMLSISELLLESFFSAYNLLFQTADGLYKITNDVNYPISAVVDFWFAVEGGVTDTTAEYDVVEVRQDDDWGVYELDVLVNTPESRIHGWSVEINPSGYVHRNDNYSEFISDTQDAYDNIIDIYGSWPWGVGAIGSPD